MTASSTPIATALLRGALSAGAAASVALWFLGWVEVWQAAVAVGAGSVALVRSWRGRSTTRFPRFLRAGFAVAVGTWGAVASGLMPATQEGLAVACTFAFAAFAVASAAGYFHSEAGTWSLRVADFVSFQAAVTVFGLDLGLRVFAELRPTTVFLPSVASARAQVEAYRFAPGVVRFGFPCNSLGYYDDELPVDDDRPWIAVVGDSFVASQVPQPLHFSTVAEDITGEVLQCFGVHGAGPREYCWLLEHEVLPREPDAIVLCLFVSNDVTDSGRVDPSWFLRCFHPDNAPLFFWRERRAQLGRTLEVAGGSSTRGWHEGSEIVIATEHGQLRGTRQQLRESLPAIAPWFFDRSLQQGVFGTEEYIQLERELASQVCAPQSRCWPSFERAMAELLATLGTVPTCVLLIPDEFQVESTLWAEITRVHDSLERDLPQRRIGSWLDEHEVPVVDALPALRDATEREGPLYLLRDTHLGIEGNAVLGRVLAAFLERWRR